MHIKVGCCGFCFSKKKYYSLFNVVEVQNTFYKIISQKLASSWRKESPEWFEFVPKAWMALTHDPNSTFWRKKGLPHGRNVGLLRCSEDNLKLWKEFLESIKPLNPELIIFQSPPSFEATEENIDNAYRFFKSIRGDVDKIGWEVRHESWKDKLNSILRELDIIHVVDPLYDRPALVGRTSYFRLHGGRKGRKIVYKYKYGDEELSHLAEFISGLSSEVSYVMFNNSYMGEDSQRFLSVLKSISTSTPQENSNPR